MGIYANYAATAPALSEAVARELKEYLGGLHLNAGRNFEGLEAGAIALRARRAIGTLFGAADPLRVIFTSGATAALNMAIQGLVRPGDQVLATSVEHNAAARPLEDLRERGVIDLVWLPCAQDGSLDPGTLRRAIGKTTRLLVMTHASNVLGTLLPVGECFRIAHEAGIRTIVDLAQTGGHIPFALDETCDAAVFAGHKGLGGLAGAGGLVLGKSAAAAMRPWILGGTGSGSHSLAMPEFLPDKFEPGTQNTLGILSLAASVEELLSIGIETIRERDRSLTSRFIAGLRGLRKPRICGTGDPERSVAVVSLTIPGCDAGELARRLFDGWGIITRSGLHCSPLAHKTAGTFPGGTVRFSFGRGTTEAEIDAILEAIADL
ncbi:MAG: aminotransferase class V-fold PLP-dependent enzyme [Treponema sp.]|jgi:cysteine desulfurase family protein|nr:aminotransferase class V-fold PLP-dependent enzyme [Treponema sp.]